MIGASTQVDHKPANNLPGIKIAEMERKEGIKVHTKPTTSMTAKLQQVEIKPEPTRLRFKLANKTSAASSAQYGSFIRMDFR
jgi:cell division septation protein DedD